MRRHSPLEVELQELLNKVTAAQTTLHSLNVEVQAAQRKQLQLKDDISVQTERLLKNQATTLLENKLQWEAEIDTTQRRVDELKAEHADLSIELTSLQDALSATRDQVDAQKTIIKELDEQIATHEEASQDLLNQRGELSGQIATAEAELGELSDIKASLHTDIEELKQQRVTIETIRASDEETYLKFKADKEAEVERLNQRLLSIKQVALREQSELDIARKEIATRTKVLDERETILRRREFKARQDEDTIRENANLLEL